MLTTNFVPVAAVSGSLIWLTVLVLVGFGLFVGTVYFLKLANRPPTVDEMRQAIYDKGFRDGNRNDYRNT